MRWTWIKGRRKGTLALGAFLTLVVGGAVVAARTGGVSGRESHTSTGSSAGVSSAPAIARDAKAAVAPEASGQAAGAPVPQIAPVPPGGTGTGTVAPTGPRIVRNADIAVRVGKGRFGPAFDRVASIAAANGGYVTSSTTSTSGGSGRSAPPRSGQLTVRLPSERFDDTRRALGQLGTVEQESLRGEDVSGQLVDQDARLRSLQAQEDSLRTLLSKATGVSDVLQVQNALFAVRQQIEQLQAQQTQLDQSATLATIQVSVYEPGASPIGQPEPLPATGLAHDLDRARDGAVAVLGGMIVVLGWLVPVAAVGGLVWGGLRLRRRAGAPGGPAAVPAPADV